MSKNVARWALAAALCAAFAMTSSAQTGKWQIDSHHSTASLTLNSSGETLPPSWNVGIAKASGTVKLDENDPTKAVINLSIYPAGQGKLLLNPDGSFKPDGIANLSRYTVMSFESKRAALANHGRLELTGNLTIAYIEREASITLDNAYRGPVYGEPTAHTTTHEATFIVQTPTFGTAPGQNDWRSEILALATISRKDFPGLQTALSAAVWPIVVEDEHCEIPQIIDRDYRGAICTGNSVLVASPEEGKVPQRFGIDYPGPDGVTAPASNTATILVHLQLIRRSSRRPQGPQ